MRYPRPDRRCQLRDHELVQAAELYYEHDLSQQAVAERMNVSRTTVSRMLQTARDRGIVRISIHRPVEVHRELSVRLAAQFDLEEVIVVAGNSDYEIALENVGHAAAEAVVARVEPGHLVGVSWGHTMYHLVQAMPEHPVDGVTVAQMSGALGGSNPEIDGPDVARRMANKLGGSHRYMHAPTVVESGDLKDRLVQQPLIKESMELLANADLCVFSVGTLSGDLSSMERSGHIDARQRNQLIEEGAVGHLIARMINRDGHELERYNRRVVAIPFSYLRRAKWSICAAASAHKGAATLAALRGDYITTLIVDLPCAEEVLRLDQGR